MYAIGLRSERRWLYGSQICYNSRRLGLCSGLLLLAFALDAQADPASKWRVEFDHSVKDAGEHEYLDRIPTAFTLSSEEIIRLRRAAHLLVEESPEMRNFIEQSARSANEPRP